ncbi:MAG: hypothetical protein ACXW5U_05330 [Thermoanaerobaculia bacterium]
MLRKSSAFAAASVSIRSSTPGDARRLHALDVLLGYPLRPDLAADRAVHDGMCRDSVTNGVLERVPVLQIGDPLIAILAIQATQIRSWHEPVGRGEAETGLKDEPLVLLLLRFEIE